MIDACFVASVLSLPLHVPLATAFHEIATQFGFSPSVSLFHVANFVLLIPVINYTD